MKAREIMTILQGMRVAVFATVDQDGIPHARHAHIGVANEKGLFFMTSLDTDFYQQLMANDHVAVTAMSEDGYLVQVIRIEGRVRRVDRAMLEELLVEDSYVRQVYPDRTDQHHIQVFQLYEGQGFYHSLTQGHKYVFPVGTGEAAKTKTIV